MPVPRKTPSKTTHRGGWRFKKAKALMFAEQGTRCWACSHEGAYEADHIICVSDDPTQDISADMLRPSHGTNYPCQECGCKANQQRGNRKDWKPPYRPTYEW